MKTNKAKIAYHVFTDGLDEYVSTKKEAMEIISKWRKDGATNLRVHKLTEVKADEPDKEELIYTKGNFPY